VTDDEGATATVEHPVTISRFLLQPNADDPAKTDLIIGGSRGGDTILVESAPNGINVIWNHLPGRRFQPTGQVVVYGGDGGDRIVIDPRVNLETRLAGGAGADRLIGGGGADLLLGGSANDVLFGRRGADLLLGGAGNDTLAGGRERDILIGDTGRDVLKGGRQDDVLIAGFSTWDDDATALGAIMSEWNSYRDHEVRTQNLRDGTGSLDPANGLYYFVSSGSDATVFSDSDMDRLTGGTGRDWFFAGAEDALFDLVPDLETRETI
jgi:Ca2+-binding RTX toxin-like protein